MCNVGLQEILEAMSWLARSDLCWLLEAVCSASCSKLNARASTAVTKPRRDRRFNCRFERLEVPAAAMAEVVPSVYCRTPRNPQSDDLAVVERCRDRDLHLFSTAFASLIFVFQLVNRDFFGWQRKTLP